MANKCGQCLLFEGPGKKCGAEVSTSAGNSAPPSCFKGPASLFSGNKCGGCRLFQGPKQKCGAGRTAGSSLAAPPACFSPIPG